MRNWLIETNRGGCIVILATTAHEAKDIAATKYCDDPIIGVEPYNGSEPAMNEPLPNPVWRLEGVVL